MKTKILVPLSLWLFICITPHFTYAQLAQFKDTLTLRYCHQRAVESSPLLKQKLYYESIAELSSKSHATINYPRFLFAGQATYQTDVFSLPFLIPGLDSPIIPKDQYKLNIDFYQNIYDGGSARIHQQLDNHQLQINTQNVEISIYKIHEVINKLFFSILLFQENMAILNSTYQDLENQLAVLNARIREGSALSGSAKVLKKEMLTIQQVFIQMEQNKISSTEMLSKWIEEPISIETQFTLPTTIIEESQFSQVPTRPELRQFDLQLNKLESEQSLVSTARIPDIGVFGLAGMGYPNPLNWFDVQFTPYGLVGLKFSWNIADYGVTKRKKEIFQLHGQVLMSEKENY